MSRTVYPNYWPKVGLLTDTYCTSEQEEKIHNSIDDSLLQLAQNSHLMNFVTQRQQHLLVDIDLLADAAGKNYVHVSDKLHVHNRMPFYIVRVSMRM